MDVTAKNRDSPRKFLPETPFALPCSTDCPSEALDTDVLAVNYQTPTAAKSVPTYPNVQLHGFFQADAGWFGQDAVNKASLAAINGVPNGDLQDGADFRRARLSAGGDVAENIGYFVEYDFAFPGRPSFMDHIVDLRTFCRRCKFATGLLATTFLHGRLDERQGSDLLRTGSPFHIRSLSADRSWSL